MSKTTITELSAAESAYAAQVEAFREARDEYRAAIDTANDAIREFNRLDAAVRAGNASAAGQRITAKAKADDLTEISEAYDKAVQVAQRHMHAAHSDLIVERLRASTGAMLSTPALRELEAEAQRKIDEVLFELADKVAAHNAELSAAVATVKAAQQGGNVRAAVSAHDTSNGKTLNLEGTAYTEHSESIILGNTVGHPADRWRNDRNTEAIAAAKAAHEAKRAEQAALAEQALRDMELRISLDDAVARNRAAELKLHRQ